MVVLVAAVKLAMLGDVLEDIHYSATAYITALTIDYLMVIFGFLVALDVILQQSIDFPERPALH